MTKTELTQLVYILPRDRAITISSCLQIALAFFLVAFACCSWAAFPVGSPAAVIFDLLETLGYGLASTIALAGSLSRFAERRRWLYRLYAISFPVIVGATVIGVALPRGNALTAVLIFAVVYTAASLIANPTLIVMAWRWRMRPSDNIALAARAADRSPMDVGFVEVQPPLTADEIIQAVREGRDRS